MIFVFKTSVKTKMQIKKLKPCIDKILSKAKWNFDLEDPTRPKRQYCYYRQTVSKGKAIKYTIATDGTPNPPSPLAKLSFNFELSFYY